MMNLNKEGLRKRLRKSQWERVLPEIRSVSTIDLAFKAENVLEKLIWLILGMLGIVWASYFVGLIIEDENPIVTVEKDVKLTEIKKPAITVCSKGSNKFGVVDRLGNHLDANNLPEIFSAWFTKMMVCRLLYDMPYVSFSYENFINVCPKHVQSNITSCEESI